jgi:hypothetical protein
MSTTDTDPSSGFDARLHAPATLRNRDALRATLRPRLPASGTVLEVASGTGEHVSVFAGDHPDLLWQPSDPDPEMRASIDAHVAAAGCGNVAPACDVDATAETWRVGPLAAVLCINMVHIAPWAATLGLFRGAANHLGAGGPLLLYGPFKRGGQHTADSNAQFDARLRASDPRWGVRDLDDLSALGAQAGLDFVERVDMPANNMTLVFRRR